MKRSLLFFIPFLLFIQLSNAGTVTWTATKSGNWNDPTVWTISGTNSANHTYPSSNGWSDTSSQKDAVIVPGFTVTLTANSMAYNLALQNGTLQDGGFSLSLFQNGTSTTGSTPLTVTSSGNIGTHSGTGSIILVGNGYLKIYAGSGLTVGNLTINQVTPYQYFNNICALNSGNLIVTGIFTLNNSGVFCLGTKTLTLYNSIVGAANFSAGSVVTGNGTSSLTSGSSVSTAGAIVFKNSSVIFPANLLSTSSPLTGLTIDVGSGNTYTLPGNLTMSSGKLVITSGTFSTGTNTLSVGAASSSIAPGAILVVASGGTANFNGQTLTIQSDVTGSGSIAAVNGTLSGVSAVTVQKYIPGKRAFRLIGHPFSNSIALNKISGLDMTGTGVGFTSTATNNPSVFWYNTSAGNSSSNPDPGWTAFTDTTLANTQWSQYRGINILVRGALGEGLTGSAYTPSATTISIASNSLSPGSLNVGNQTVTAIFGTNSGYNLISNPYPSSIDLQKLTLGANISPNFYLWDLSLGTRGGYTTVAYTGSGNYIIPIASAFFVRATAATNNTIGFTESAKSSAALSNTNLAGTANSIALQLKGENDIIWDNLLINFDDNAANGTDKKDALKLLNPDASFYTINADGASLAIDYRPLSNKISIPLGITTSANNKYTIQVSALTAATNSTIFLHDKLTDTYTKIETGASYSFTATSTEALNNRFEITSAKSSNTLTTETTAGNYTATVSSTPTQFIINYSAPSAAATTVRLINTNGIAVRTTNAGIQTKGTITIANSQFAQGLYIVEVKMGNQTIIQKLIK
jgi:hypothetical protein